MLTSIFSPSQCAQCKLCCHFHHSSAWETPFLEPELAEQLKKMFHVELLQRDGAFFTFRLPFKTDSDEETANCPMLDTVSGCRLPREQRPFECRIWPLRIMRCESGATVLGCYMGCPALDSVTADRLAAYAHGELRSRLLDYARHFPQTIRPFDANYRILEALPELDGILC